MEVLNQNIGMASLIHQTKPRVTYLYIKQDNVCLYDLINFTEFFLCLQPNAL